MFIWIENYDFVAIEKNLIEPRSIRQSDEH